MQQRDVWYVQVGGLETEIVWACEEESTGVNTKMVWTYRAVAGYIYQEKDIVLKIKLPGKRKIGRLKREKVKTEKLWTCAEERCLVYTYIHSWAR